MSSSMAQPPPLIALMGRSGSGKSSFINAIAGREIAVIGRGLTSETSKITAYEATYKGRPIILVDTPSFDSDDLGLFRDATERPSNKDGLCQIADFLSRTFQTDHKISALIYTHNITRTRMGRASAHDITLFRKICAEHASGTVTVVTTFWDFLETVEMGERREVELKSRLAFFAGLEKKGATFQRCGMTAPGKPLIGPGISTPCSIIDGILGLESTKVDLGQEVAVLSNGLTKNELAVDVGLHGEYRRKRKRHYFVAVLKLVAVWKKENKY